MDSTTRCVWGEKKFLIKKDTFSLLLARSCWWGCWCWSQCWAKLKQSMTVYSFAKAFHKIGNGGSLSSYCSISETTLLMQYQKAKAIKRNLRKKLGFCPDRWGPSFPQDTQNKIIINFISHIILFQAISHWRAPQSLWYHIPNIFGHSFTQIDCYAILQATNTVQYNVVLWMSYVAR